MTDMTLDEYYKANIDREKEYVSIFIAWEVKAGEQALHQGNPVTVQEDGYQIGSYHSNAMGKWFMTKAEFAAQTRSAEGLGLPVPKKDLAYEGYEKKVTRASNGGFNLKRISGTPIFMSEIELTSQYNYESKSAPKEFAVTLNSAATMKGILLDSKTTLTLGSNTEIFLAGDLMLVDAKSPSGYTVVPMRSSPNLELRVVNYHDIAVENQKKLKTRAPHVVFE
jgi:hypothetical protein